jgi:hypothetical protein
VFVCLRELGLSFNPVPSGVAEQLVHALVCDFPVEEFAHAWLRLRQYPLQLGWRILSRVLQDRLVQIRFELQDRGLLGGESQVIEHIATRYIVGLLRRPAMLFLLNHSCPNRLEALARRVDFLSGRVAASFLKTVQNMNYASNSRQVNHAIPCPLILIPQFEDSRTD